MDGVTLSVLFVPRHVPVPGTCVTPYRFLEPDQMEASVKPRRLIRGVLAEGSGVDGEHRDKCVLCREGPWRGPEVLAGRVGVKAGRSRPPEADTQRPVMGRHGCFLLGAGSAV